MRYKLGIFAQMIGVCTKTLQRWDREGFCVAFRTNTNRRYYTDDHYVMLKRIKDSQGYYR